jgi:hypothetical protein
MARRQQSQRHDPTTAKPPAPVPMDDNNDSDDDDEMALIMGPPHQPSPQEGASGYVFDRNMIHDGRPLVAALLYLAGRLSTLPDYDKVCAWCGVVVLVLVVFVGSALIGCGGPRAWHVHLT